MLRSNPLKKCKNHPKEFKGQKLLLTVIKVKISIFGHFLLLTFSHEFFATFSMYLKSASNSVIFDTHIAFLKKFFLSY